jgi:hypothetical protein
VGDLRQHGRELFLGVLVEHDGTWYPRFAQRMRTRRAGPFGAPRAQPVQDWVTCAFSWRSSSASSASRSTGASM